MPEYTEKLAKIVHEQRREIFEQEVKIRRLKFSLFIYQILIMGALSYVVASAAMPK